ncbi:MAG: ABC transporter ATP-binding protein [Desulfarculus sp.]|nr:ABC transporter ATP-binding protein [Desulfarculus sp.]
MAILRVSELTKDFSGLRVLTGVDFEVGPQEKLAIIGPNGAGKTTLFNIVSGKFPPTSGQVRFKDEVINSLPPHLRARRGMARSFQITNLFQKLSVLENVLSGVRSRLGLRHHMLRQPLRDRELVAACDAILEKVGLSDLRETPVQELAYGQQRALELGVTLALEPELILLDEPTAGMSRQETEDATAMIKRVTGHIACVIIEHDMNVVFSLADRIAVLHYGVILACGAPEDIRRDQRVKDAYLGEEES